jgi:DNA polymerase III subunit delta'
MPFRDVIGHRTLVSLLSRSIERDALPPSLIFAGPAGVGKRLVALSTAQSLNCLEPRRAPQSDTIPYDACGVCAACTRISRGVFSDVVEITPSDTGSIKVEPIRDVIEQVAYKPFEGRRRVVTFDQADALVTPAQNALLKTLEEPPSSAVFILVSARPDLLLPTVRSRCLQLRFQKLDHQDVADWLTRGGESQANAFAIAALATGSIGRAKEIRAEEMIVARNDALSLLTRFASTDKLGTRMDAASKALVLAAPGVTAAEQRAHLSLRLRAVQSFVRDVELINVNGDRRSLANPDLEEQLEKLVAFRGERGRRAFLALDEALEAVGRNQGVKIIADWVATEL